MNLHTSGSWQTGMPRTGQVPKVEGGDSRTVRVDCPELSLVDLKIELQEVYKVHCRGVRLIQVMSATEVPIVSESHTVAFLNVLLHKIFVKSIHVVAGGSWRWPGGWSPTGPAA